jgi:large subunit ribosomal protein L3
MPLGIIGKKIGMTRLFDKEAGCMIPVTVIDVAGNEYLQVKTSEKEGYSAYQLGYGDQKPQRLTKPALGTFKKYGASPKKLIMEFRVDSDAQLPDTSAGNPTADFFQDGQWVDVVGTSKGKGFQGVVRRYNFAGQPDTHGHMMHRRTGAISAGTSPGRVWKGQKMPGHMGNAKATVQNLKVVKVRAEDNVILVSGAVPGHNGAYVVIRPAKKKSAK